MYTDDTSFIFDKCENIWEVVDDIVYELLVIVNVIFSTSNSSSMQVPDLFSKYVKFLGVYFDSSLNNKYAVT